MPWKRAFLGDRKGRGLVIIPVCLLGPVVGGVECECVLWLGALWVVLGFGGCL